MSSDKKYLREGKPIKIKSVEDRKLKGTLRKNEKRMQEAAKKALQTEVLLTEEAGFIEAEGIERTWKFQQKQLKDHVDLGTAKKMFNLELEDFGPYALDYTRNGKYLLIGGRKGHVATFDWQKGKIESELQLRETVRDVKWLHNETMYAVAQKKHVYVYDKNGLELHVLKDHIEATKLEFLPYHFLLASVGNAGYLKYQDVSTGKLVSELRTRLGKCDAMALNPWNAIINLGHANGTVTLWSPTMSTPLVKMLCHKGPVLSLAVDQGGHYLATSGTDGQLKMWDIRTYKELNAYYTPRPAKTVTISQRGLLGMGYGPHISIWKDCFKTKQKEPYMSHLIPGSEIVDLAFCPFEDVLGAGHAKGISSLVIPGSGEPNFDTMEANPFQTTKQRQETEIHSLLDKIQPEMIALDPSFVGRVDRAPKEVIAEEQRKEWEANHPNEKFVPRNRARGKSTAQRRYLRKQQNVIDQKREELKEKMERDQKSEENKSKPKEALDRFSRS
ncbi:WD40-repeat-containing domain protein, partial [Gorgonomyces haynaldii]